jgi:HAD superfamily hydrolase (TIGR01509 family)
VEKLLRLLKEKKLRIALSSSSARHWIDLILARLKIRGFFEVVVSREEVKKSKPWPEIYLLTAKKLSLTPKECLVLEDTPPGIEAAKKAGMKCLAVPNKFNQQADFSQADWVLRSLVEIDYHFLKSKLSLAN